MMIVILIYKMNVVNWGSLRRLLNFSNSIISAIFFSLVSYETFHSNEMQNLSNITYFSYKIRSI